MSSRRRRGAGEGRGMKGCCESDESKIGECD